VAISQRGGTPSLGIPSGRYALTLYGDRAEGTTVTHVLCLWPLAKSVRPSMQRAQRQQAKKRQLMQLSICLIGKEKRIKDNHLPPLEGNAAEDAVHPLE